VNGSTRSRGRVVAAALALALLATTGVLAFSTGRSARRVALSARLLGPTEANQSINFSLVLRLPGERKLQQLLAAVYDPRSPQYHHFIDARMFGDRFGLSNAALASVRRVLSAAGVQITGEYPQRTAIDARAPAAVVDRLFATRLLEYVARDGRRFHEPQQPAVVPMQLRGAVTAVAGLNGRYLPFPSDVPANGLRPPDTRLVYDINPLYSHGIEGQGEKIGVMSFSQFSQSDLDAFDQQFGLPAFTPQVASVSDLGPSTDTSQDGEGEAMLDLEVVHEVAPQAQVIDYNAPWSTTTTDYSSDTMSRLVDKIVADGQVNVVNVSYGICEQLSSSADIQRSENSFASAALHGISLFVATQDAGAYACQRAKSDAHELSVSYPSSSPNVIAVGGTSLSVGANDQYVGEAPWESALEYAGGGGGLSTLFAKPSWQQALGVSNRYSNGKRELPDISADADPATGWTIVQGGQLITNIGGTSAAAPFWTGSMALIDQYARQQGIRQGIGGVAGDVDPMLYAIASSPQAFPPFHDITYGTNRYYPATVGWDFATGLGSPDVWNLARDVASYLKSHRK